MRYHAAKKVQPHVAAAGNMADPPHRKFLSHFHALFLCCYQENLATEQWMSQIVKKCKSVAFNSRAPASDPFAKLNKFIESDPLSREECSDIIVWYGVSPRSLIA